METEIQPTYQRINRKHFYYLVLFFVAYCFFLSWSFLFQNVDDAYISFRYGKNLMEGKGLVFNQGEYVEGYTNFLWTILTSPFTLFGSPDISYFASAIGLFISILNIFLIAKLSKLFSGLFFNKSSYFLLLPAIMFVLDNSIAFWAIGGMEFPLYTCFILASAFYYFTLNENKYGYIILSVYLMFTTLSRPEGNMIFVLTMTHMILNRKKIEGFEKKFLTITGLYGLFAAAYYGFKYFYYGQMVPNTFYAKGVTDFSMNLILGLKYFVVCFGSRIYIFLFIFFIPFKKAFNDFRLSYLLLFTGIYLVYIVAVGGDWMIANRFFVPVIPFLYLLSSIGVVFAFDRLYVFLRERKKSVNPFVSATKIINNTVRIILFILLVYTVAFLEYNQLIIKDDNAHYEKQWSMFGKWLKQNVDPKTVLAVGPAGKIPYYSELYTIDMWGLNNSFIANTKSKRLQAGHKKFDFEYVLSLNPEFLIGYAGFTDEMVPQKYEKFNAPEDEYKCMDIVFRLKPEYRKLNGSR